MQILIYYPSLSLSLCLCLLLSLPLFQLDHYPPVSYTLPDASDTQFNLVKTLFLGKVFGECLSSSEPSLAHSCFKMYTFLNHLHTMNSISIMIQATRLVVSVSDC